MGEDEKKAIEDLNSFKSISILYGNTFTMFLDQLKKYQQATDIVLNLVQNLQRENDLLNNYVKENETYKKNLFNYAEKKDKQICELVKYIDSNNYVDSEECQFQEDFKIKCIGNGDCIDCIKQYFATKAKEKGE